MNDHYLQDNMKNDQNQIFEGHRVVIEKLCYTVKCGGPTARNTIQSLLCT